MCKNNSILTLKNVSKIYKYKEKNDFVALNDISIEICKHDFIGLCGPSGSGKSTLLNILGLIDKQTTGEIIFERKNISEKSVNDLTDIRRNKIGFIFQDFNLIPTLTVEENILVSLWNNPKIKEYKEILDELLFDLGIEKFKKCNPNYLSGGQQQRVAIARALIKRPLLILADEPTANLDSKNSLLVLGKMKELSAKIGTTFIISSHDNDILNNIENKFHIIDGKISHAGI